MPARHLIKILSKVIDPFRVFIALMLAVGIWLAPILFRTETKLVQASPLRQDCRVCAEWNESCSNNGCRRQGCVAWVWEPCVGGEEPIPLTISGSVGCSVGGNSWCVGNTWLNLAASAPQGAAVIISGSVNGIAFACPAGNTTCSVPITDEGDGTATFRVDSDSGDSAGNSTSYKLDASTPQISGSINGASGANGWFISEADFSASASDSVSGLASLEIQVDGGEWQTYTDPITLNDGLHTVLLRAYDYAGNMAETNQTISVDTLTPRLDISVSGAAGSNGWYISETEIFASASDPSASPGQAGSGIASLEVSVDGGGWSNVNGPLYLLDGIHSLEFRATDNAGNVIVSSREVKVDTITPSLTLSVNGTKGINGWYKSVTQTSAGVNDSGSGIAMLEAAVDGGTWTPVNGSLSFSDGIHNWQFRVTDNAGNVTKTPVQSIRVDATPPVIEMEEELALGETLYYQLSDSGSGLSGYRAVIEDDAEKYQKISWVDSLSGNKVEGDILWDGNFKDGTKAGMGDYFITLKISDAAGNETMKSAVLSVDIFSVFQSLPEFIIPQNDMDEVAPIVGEETGIEQSFGNANSGNSTAKISSSTSSGGGAVPGGITSQISFAHESQTANISVNGTNILWGAAAASLVGATLADWQRKRKEEEARRAAAREERRINGPSTYRQAAMNYQRSLDNFNGELLSGGFLQTEARELKTQAILSGFIPSAKDLVEKKQEEKREQAARQREKIMEREARIEAAEERHNAEEAERQKAMAAYRAGEREDYSVTPQESWWEKTLNWVDNHQIGTSMGVGAIVGLAAIGITLAVAATITLPVLAVAAGIAAVAAGVTVAAGTAALNTHFDRPPITNIWNNVKAASLTAAVVSGVGLFVAGGLLTQAAIVTGNAIAGTCGANPTICANAGTILNVVDTLEQASLQVQLMVETATGNPHAGETALELQLELMDGGVPGNAVASELGEQLAKLGDDVPVLIAAYGDEIVPLLLQYGDEAVDIIGAYGDEGIALLLKYGDDTGQVIDLVKQFGTPAVKVLDAVDPASAEKLLNTLDGDVLDYAMKQGPDAVAALSRWSNKELMEFGPELALRAKKDAKVLESINKLVALGPIDPKHLTTEQKGLIKIIAENSMQYSDEGQIVLGKWVDYGNGFTSYARETGSVHYNPHPDMWNLLGELGDQREGAAWLVNKQVIQTGIEKGLPFEYTLNGINSDNLINEMDAIQVMWSGADDIDILKALDDADRVDIPVRTKELKELYNAHYQLSYDAVANSYILIKP